MILAEQQKTHSDAILVQDNCSRSWHALIAAWLGIIFDGMDASLFALLLFPAVSELIGTQSHSAVGVFGSIIMATFMIGYACGGVVFGIAADYIGRTKIMIFTILLYAIATGLCAICNTWEQLAVCRLLVGLGIGGEISVGGVMVAEYWQGKARLHATGALMGSFAVCYLVAAIINLMFGHLGWRFLIVVGIMPALLTLYVRSKVKEPLSFQLLQEHKREIRLRTVSQRTVKDTEFLRFTLPALFAGENVRKTLVATLLSSTAIVGYWAVVAWIPPWINQLTGTQAVEERSMAAIVLNIGAILACALTGFFVSAVGRANSFRFAFAGSLFCCMAMFLTTKKFGTELLGWVFFVGAFASMPFALLMIHLPELFELNMRGTAVGFTYNVGRFLAAGAAIIGGQLIALFGGSYAAAGACMATLYSLGLITSYFMPKSTGELTIHMLEGEPS